MSNLVLLAVLIGVFLFGAFCGAIVLAMCMSNEAYENDHESYELGYQEGWDKAKQSMMEDFEDTCSHCSYKGAI